MANHGVYVAQQATTAETTVVTSGIPFIIGKAPFGDGATGTAGTPVLCNNFDEAEAAMGYSDTWSTYTICEAMYSQFEVFNMGPAIFLPLASSATDSDVASAVEKIELCMTMFGMIPDIIIAPGHSDVEAVRSAMVAKAKSINGLFKAKAITDLTSASVTAAISAKTSGTYTSDEIVCYPAVKIGTKQYHLSTIVAGRISATDNANGDVPYESPSNKSIAATAICLPDGTDMIMSLADANSLNAKGIVTALNFMGNFVVWGNYTAVYPTSTDAKDIWISVSRMFGYVSNTLIQTFWSYLDRPMTRRLIDTILDQANIWLNGMVGAGYMLGARVEMLDSENSATNLAQGIIKLHVYITPAGPAQEIDFTLEYDTDYLSVLTGEEE